MTSELEKIDIIRKRFGVGYKEAKEALDAAGGDLVRALIDLEERDRNFGERMQARGQELVGQVKEFFNKSRDCRIKVKRGEETVAEIPAALGALGVIGILASSEIAAIGALGTMAAMAGKYTLEFERRERGPEPECGAAGDAGV
ncbi:MAG TPA: DUF4342 domain-containing protein [Bacillota bacterium]|nr:DUF4342 domain-containing protein [Bacillota bacterium]